LVDFELSKKFKYVFIHGYRGSTNNDFFPWLTRELEKRGNKVEMFNLPGGDNPRIEDQAKFLLKKHVFDENTIIIAHSLGCVDAFKLLPKLAKKIYKLILVAPPLSPSLLDGEKRPGLETATDWKFDYNCIKNKVNEIVVIRDENDDVILPIWSERVAEKLSARLLSVKANKSHFNSPEENSILDEAVVKIKVFTTRPDTLFGATFLVLSPEHPLVASIENKEVKDYVKSVKGKSDRDRLAEGKEKTGVFSGLYAVNPVNNEKIPVWIADYVLMGYGTGAIMAVPAHDERDFEFAKKYNLPIKQVISPASSVIFVHGCPNSVENCKDLSEKSNIKHWMVKAREDLRSLGYKVHIPIMPKPWEPKYEDWKSEFEKVPIDENSIIVAASCGGSFIVRWLSEAKKKIAKLILVAPAKQAAEGKGENLDTLRRFYDYEIGPNIKNYVGESVIITSNDEERHLRSADLFEKALNAKRIRIEGKKHFAVEELPEIISLVTDLSCAYVGEGKIINSEEWNGWKTPESIGKVIEWLEEKRLGKKEVNFHLRDWLISRQRYWGPPIPMINCPKCSWQSVEEKDLPVLLPFIKDYKPLGTGVAPLANHPEFYETTCPKCKGRAKRETDVSDTFLDSAWYFLRYVSTDIDNTAFDRERVKKWLPVNMYIGGAEHSVLHLLYSRFVTMALKDLGLISFEEPFTKFRVNGLIVKDGAKMSKSKGNVVIPDEYVRKLGADTLRTYMMFMGPFSQGGDFRDTGIEGMHRFIKRVYTLFIQTQNSPVPREEKLKTQKLNDEALRMMHKTIKKVTEDISNLSYNTAIAGLMEWYNYLAQNSGPRTRNLSEEEVESFLKLLAPFAPHVSEELYQLLNKNDKFSSIHTGVWPTYDPKFLVKEELVIIIQVNGKLRGNVIVDPQTARDRVKVEELGKKDSNVAKHLEAGRIKKVIYIEGKVLNFVLIP
jgi:leucyl-tRNA synthetase